MKAKDGVIDRLNAILSAGLVAISRYFVHARLCGHWGYERLHRRVRGHSIEVMKDADRLIGHILYLEEVPRVHPMGAVHLGETVPDQLQCDLKAERELLTLFDEGVRHCAKAGDFTSRHLLEDMAKQCDARIDWIETQLAGIEQAGLETYLAEQLREDG